MHEEHSLEEIIAACKRIADRCVESTEYDASEQRLRHSTRGTLGSDMYFSGMKKIFAARFEELCGSVIERVVELATGSLSVYLESVHELLNSYKELFVENFRESTRSSRRSVANRLEEEAASLRQRLEAALQGAIADFRLSFPPGDKPMSADQIDEVLQDTGGYLARVYKVMIASPSDVTAERNIVRDVIYEWNVINSEDRSKVLLPVGWETHSSPYIGDRPQEIINKQILRGCDLLVAVFWTKLGTPTGKAESGTVEEIEEHLQAGKPALIYFSSEPVHPESIEQEQYRALKEFESKLMKRGLVEKYETKSEFKDKFSRQLSLTVIRSFTDQKDDDGPLGLPVQVPTETENRIAISDEAEELLMEASKDQQGIIIKVQYLSGTEIQTNRRNFAEGADARQIAKWRGAIDELQNQGLIEDRSSRGEVFHLTKSGWDLADQLSKNL